MKKYIWRIILSLALLVAVGLLNSPRANAANPNGLLITTSFQANNSTTRVPYATNGSVSVAVVPNLIPITKSPYCGFHLDVDPTAANSCGGAPEVNSFSYNTTGAFGSTGQQGAFWSKDSFIWCGEDGGLNCGDLKLNVYVSTSPVVVGGVARRGHWNYATWRQYGSTIDRYTSAVNDTSAIVATCNPGTLVVQFTFIEDPPQVNVTKVALDPATWQEYTVAETQSLYPGVYSSDQSLLTLSAKINGVWDYPAIASNTTNPSRNDPANFTILEQIDGTVRVQALIPSNWVIRKVYLNGIYQGDICTAGSNSCIFTFTYDYSKDSMNVQFDYLKLVYNYLICPTSGSYIPFAPGDFEFAVGAGNDISKSTKWLYGYAYDSFHASDEKRIKIDVSRPGQNVVASYTTASGLSAPTGLSGLIPKKGRPWALYLANKGLTVDNWEARGYYDDGAGNGTHYVPMYGNPVNWGPGFANDCNINFYQDAISWLKTENGNVLSSTGYIQGNNLRTLSSQTTTVQTTVEGFNKAEYLVMAKIGKSFPFCSTYDYLLTNTLADGVASPSCGTGSGYTLNTYDLNTNSQDSVVRSVRQAYDNAICRLEKVYTTLNPSVLPTDLAGITTYADATTCPNGTVYKITAPAGTTVTLPALTGVNRRATILVDGTNGGSANAIINGNITYSTSSYPYNSMQSLAIVVNGNIYIKGGVTSIAPAPSIQAALYSAGKINTCYETIAAAQTRACDKQLIIEGMLVGKNGFQFQRTLSYTDIRQYTDPTTNLFNDLKNRVDTPAELVRFSPNIVINPPPGLNLYDFYSTTGYKYLLDKAEYSPRF